MITRFEFLHSISLTHASDCALLGLAPDGRLFVEEFYAEDYLAQHQILDGKIIASQDEDAGMQEIVPYDLPPNSILASQPYVHPLNYHGLRWRGLREEEQTMNWLLPLTIMEKMPLLAALGWDLSPMLLLGIAESHVLAEAKIDEGNLLCRRIRLAFALPQKQKDEAGLDYDYDSREFYLLHAYDAENELAPPLHECVGNFAGLSLQRPMDLLYTNGRLFVADAGHEDKVSRILVWKINA